MYDLFLSHLLYININIIIFTEHISIQLMNKFQRHMGRTWVTIPCITTEHVYGP